VPRFRYDRSSSRKVSRSTFASRRRTNHAAFGQPLSGIQLQPMPGQHPLCIRRPTMAKGPTSGRSAAVGIGRVPSPMPQSRPGRAEGARLVDGSEASVFVESANMVRPRTIADGGRACDPMLGTHAASSAQLLIKMDAPHLLGHPKRQAACACWLIAVFAISVKASSVASSSSKVSSRSDTASSRPSSSAQAIKVP
jgi:hypothetical protein